MDVEQLLGRGDYAGARRAGERLLAQGAETSTLLRNLGIACCFTGDFEAGTRHLRRALDLAPEDREARLHLARALTAVGGFEEAEALSEDPRGDSELAKVHAYVLQATGRPAEAARACERLVEANPSDFESWTNLGSARVAAGRATEAVAALVEARRLAPGIALIRLSLAAALGAAGQVEEGLSEAREAVRLDPRNPACLTELARALNRAGRHEEALAALQTLAAHPLVLVETGQTLAALGRFAEAEAAYRRALSLRPDLAPAIGALGALYESTNRGSDLARLIEDAAAAGAPESDLMYLSALSLRRQGRFEEALRAASAAPAPPDPADRAQLIGEIADRLGDTDRAFEAFAEANRILAAAPTDPRAGAARYRERLSAVAALTTGQWLSSWREAEPASEPPAPVFLLGCPRSGTTLLDTILMGHEQVRVLEEQPVLQRVNEALGPLERLAGLGPDEVDALRRRYFETLDEISPGWRGRLVLDKFPLAVGMVPLIHRLFPDARFIFAERHPFDVVLSCFITRFRLNDAVANFLDLEDAARLYDLVLSYWHQCLELLPLRVHRFRYEGMVADGEAELRPLLSFLGLPWDPALLDHRATAAERAYIGSPSYAQVSEKVYGRAAGRWRRYRRHLEPVIPLLAPWAERLGYATD